MICVLAGGVGAARFLAGLLTVHPADEVVVVANVGDDLELHGLRISPDLDTIVYTLAQAIDPERGWGLAGETWQAMESLGRYGAAPWFGLGDRDLGTHLYRTQRMAEGAGLATVTAEIAAAWGLGLRILPVTEDRLRTMITVLDPPPDDVAGNGADDGAVEREVTFQEYFVERRHEVPVTGLRYAGADSARPTEGVLEAIAAADVVVIAPSNPLLSIDPLLSVPGVRAAVEERRANTVAVSPIVAGSAVKGPADRMLRELGHEQSVVGVAHLYVSMAAHLVIDRSDADQCEAVEATGVTAVVTDTIMSRPGVAAALAATVLAVGRARV